MQRWRKADNLFNLSSFLVVFLELDFVLLGSFWLGLLELSQNFVSHSSSKSSMSSAMVCKLKSEVINNHKRGDYLAPFLPGRFFPSWGDWERDSRSVPTKHDLSRACDPSFGRSPVFCFLSSFCTGFYESVRRMSAANVPWVYISFV